MVQEIRENEIDDIIRTGKVLIDCYADWCGPCKMLSPIIDEIASVNDEWKFCKLNVDDAQNIQMKYGIMSIPTLLLFENGTLKTKSIGFKTKEDIEDLLK